MSSSATNLPLRDIYELDAVSFWPPAIGWWLIIVALLLAWLLLPPIWRLLRNLYYMPYGSWQRHAYQTLCRLRSDIEKVPPKETAAQLAELLRRIALARFPRNECASLSGDGWLQWLEQHDPKRFAWTIHGKVLLQLAYAPPSTDSSQRRPQLLQLLNATERWLLVATVKGSGKDRDKAND